MLPLLFWSLHESVRHHRCPHMRSTLSDGGQQDCPEDQPRPSRQTLIGFSRGGTDTAS